MPMGSGSSYLPVGTTWLFKQSAQCKGLCVYRQSTL